MIYLSEALINAFIYIGIGIIASLLCLFIFLKLIQNKSDVKDLDQEFLNNLYLALGQKDNIKSIEMKQQRLQIEVVQVKDINQELLKQINIPAFLTGKKITLLVKNNTKDVYNYLNDKRKEEY